ncbi:GNAT family N-acetyltransferase [Parasphingopyxis marina]|nr:GNAT family protein [Parasphingopyxis marina]
MFAVTKRLLLRPAWPEDAPQLAKAIADKRIVRNLVTAPWPYGLADAEQFLALPRDPQYPNFLITDRVEDPRRIIGSVGFHDREGTPELGFWLVPDRWGQGLMPEAAEAAIAAGRHCLGYGRILSGHFADNPNSGRVLQKLGFRKTGPMRQFSLARGEDVEGFEFALEAEEVEQPADIEPAMAA